MRVWRRGLREPPPIHYSFIQVCLATLLRSMGAHLDSLHLQHLPRSYSNWLKGHAFIATLAVGVASEGIETTATYWH